ncbi:MAG: glycoside hydrolase family 97 C-terminal domain-containing protein, partial [Acidobacteriota bacterium]|nr:glycoside hydrolase family 97 C-terminal domain-containing protein [Acidobacteriota bacterium]
VARRNGNEWFLGSMTNWTGREIEIPLTFLGKGDFTAKIYADTDDAAQSPKSVSIQTRTVNSKMTLKARLASGGGYAVMLVPVGQ